MKLPESAEKNHSPVWYLAPTQRDEQPEDITPLTKVSG